MSPRRLKVDQALAALPDTDDLVPLREALIGASREDTERAWAASEAYATLDTRLADPGALEARIAEIAERVRARVETVLRHSVRALRAVEKGDHAGAARALVEAGEVEEGERRMEEAERWYRKALELGRKPRDRRAEGLALRRLGRVARERGRLEEALELYRAGYEVAEAQRDTEGAVVACQGMGNVYGDQGLWEEARRWYTRGLELLGARTPSRALWELYNNLSVVELHRGDLHASEGWLNDAANVIRVLADPQGAFFTANARGRLHMAHEAFADAEREFRGALRSAVNPSSRGIALLNLAESLLRLGRPADAERAARELERTAVAHQMIGLLPHAYRLLGGIARERRDEEGFVFYEQALELCREQGAPLIELATTQHEYALFEAELGRRESARARLEEALASYAQLGASSEMDRVRMDLVRNPEWTEHSHGGD